MATIDGNFAFGTAVHINESPVENAQQINNFFGVNGQQALFGGFRGRTFQCQGVLYSDSPADVELSKQFLLSFANGLTHTVVDNRGVVYPNVILTNSFSWTGDTRPGQVGGVGFAYCRPYQLMMIGLT